MADHGGTFVVILRVRSLEIHQGGQNLRLTDFLLQLNDLGLQLRYICLEFGITLAQRSNITGRG